MDKPPKIKVDTKLVANDGDIKSDSDPKSDSISKSDSEPKSDFEPKSESISKSDSVPTPAVVSGEGTAGSSSASTAPPKVSRDLQAQRDAKKRDEQHFLHAYKKREYLVRIRFALIAIFLIGACFLTFRAVFAPESKTTDAGFSFLPSLMNGFVGERDAANFQIASLPFEGDVGKKAGVLKNRQAILDRAIGDLETSGRPAIFSRLGAQQMLGRHGQRDNGLKYGDYLIQKFPELPSNYIWRARMDFDLGDYSNSIKEFQQFADLLQKSPGPVQKAWRGEFATAIWPCLDAGRYGQADYFFNAYKRYDGSETVAKEMQSAISLARYDHLDVTELQKTNLWNADVEHLAQSLLSNAKKQTAGMNTYNYSEDKIAFAVALRSRDFPAMQKLVKMFGRHKWLRYEYVIASAEMNLAQGNPLMTLERVRDVSPDQLYTATAELSYLESTALLRLHRPQEALTAIKTGLEFYDSPGTETGRFYLPFFTLKAQALNDLGQKDQALALCQKVIVANPEMVAPRLLKMQILQSQGKQSEALAENKAITQLLTAALSSESNK